MTLDKKFLEDRGLTPEKIADTMIGFYREIDAVADRITQQLEQNGVKLQCRPGCCGCCADNLTLNRSEEAVIRKLYPNIFEEKPHEPGKCPFLNPEGLCRIYEARPFICRTHGLPLIFTLSKDEAAKKGIELDEDQEDCELIDICEKNEESVDIDNLPDDLFLQHKNGELKLAAMEMATFGEEAIRTEMRALFKTDTDERC